MMSTAAHLIARAPRLKRSGGAGWARPAAAGARSLTEPAGTDQHLVERAREGDRAAFDELVRRHAAMLRRVLLRITGDHDTANDAMQEALSRAWLGIDSFEGRSLFSTWLTRIGVNEAYRGMAREQARSLEGTDLVGEHVPGWGDSPESALESREFLAAIGRALGELPLDHRAAVVLRDVEGLSTAEAAEVLGIGERALKSRVHRGRMALRAELDHYFQEGY